MLVRPQYRVCYSCGRRYAWNPDVGQMSCPYCAGKKRPEGALKRILGSIWRKKKEIDYRE